VKLGEYGYAPPTDAIGSTASSRSGSPTKVKRVPRMATYSPTAAKKLLTDAGFTYKGSKLIDPKGNAVSLDIHVISGLVGLGRFEPDHTRNLQTSGSTRTSSSSRTGLLVPNAFATKNPTCLADGSQASPYGYFNANLSQNSLIPSGTDASTTGNWSHTANPQATDLLNKWKVTLDQRSSRRSRHNWRRSSSKHAIVRSSSARWSTYSTKYFHCFNSPKNFYGDPIFSTYPDNLLVVHPHLPRRQAGA